MEQFRQIGEVLGGLRALMVFQDEIRINRRQCGLLVDALNLAFDGVAEELRSYLKFDEKLSKWKALESPLRELHRIFKEGEQYVRQCLEPRDWWGKALALNQSADCVELHLHNLLWCVPVVLEAIENATEIAGCDQEEIYRKRLLFSKKYEKEWVEPKLFQHKLGKLYLASPEFCSRLDAAWREDRWILSETLADRRSSETRPLNKQENRLAKLMLGPNGKLHPSSVLTGSQDYQVRRRFGSGSNYKEVQWMGESFAVKHVFGEIEPLTSEISLLSSITHPNVMHYMYSFVDEEKKECFLVMDLMNRDLSSYIKEMCSSRRKVPFPLLVAVDTMLQIARGMEYLHARKVYHGDLNPSNILVKTRSASPDCYLHVKVTGFGLSPIRSTKASATSNQCIWYAPEVLQEQEQSGNNGTSSSKCTEKADVYSFAMICFELLTGKIPFEDNHLQGDKMSKNIRTGERPLFPFQSPKYLTSLTKRCWHSDPVQRPSFSSLCRVLRYIKRFLIMNPEHSQPDPLAPPIDYFDLEIGLSKRFSGWGKKDQVLRVSEVPFQMYAYRAVERERTSANFKDKSSESGSEGTSSVCGDENTFNIILQDDVSLNSVVSLKSISRMSTENNKKSSTKKANGKGKPLAVPTAQQPKARTTKPPPRSNSCGRSLRLRPESQLQPIAMSPGRRITGHASDSELP